MNWRSPRLLVAVRELPCTWPLDHRCSAGDSVVAMHSNQQRDGKGRSIKAHDYRIAAGCAIAHQQCDESNKLSRDERVAAWEEAHRRTMGLLFEYGIVSVG
jgi:hypothetical protein